MTGPSRISRLELARRAGPAVDSHGVRFEMEGRILRAFRGADALFFRSLLESGAAASLFEAGLARSWITADEVEGFDLVVESERIQVVTYPPEWATSALHEAGLTIARLGLALAHEGLGLLDGHPWNVLFDGSRAVWVDLGSIIESRGVSRGWVREFRTRVVLPLALHARGWHSRARLLSTEPRKERARALGEWGPLRYFPMRYELLKRRAGQPKDFYSGLVEYLERMRPKASRTDWSEYVQAQVDDFEDRSSWDQKQVAVDAFLGDLPRGRLLDVGSNAGWYSELAARLGYRVIAIDPDDWTLSGLFAHARSNGLPINTVLMDIMFPSGSYGLGLAYASAPERLKSDVTLWLAIVHHLVGRQGIPFAAVAHSINQFTSEAAIVEFVPRTDRFVREWPIAKLSWYEADGFIEAMRPYFPRVDVLPSSPEPRQMMLFRRS